MYVYMLDFPSTGTYTCPSSLLRHLHLHPLPRLHFAQHSSTLVLSLLLTRQRQVALASDARYPIISVPPPNMSLPPPDQLTNDMLRRAFEESRRPPRCLGELPLYTQGEQVQKRKEKVQLLEWPMRRHQRRYQRLQKAPAPNVWAPAPTLRQRALELIRRQHVSNDESERIVF